MSSTARSGRLRAFSACVLDYDNFARFRNKATFQTEPGQLSNALKIPIPTVSNTLRHLRQVDLVRYETTGIRKEYWLKDSKVSDILHNLEKWAERVRNMRP